MLLEISGEITPERMKGWSQSKNNTQLWMCLVIEARSDAVKSNIASVQFSSVTQSCLTVCNPMNCRTPGLPVHHHLPEFIQTHVHRVLKPYSQKTSQSSHTRTTALSNSVKPSHACRATQDGQVMVDRSDRMWSTGEGNGKPLQYSCLENPMNSMKRQNDRILKEELPRSLGAQYATGEQWRSNSRKNEGMKPKQKQEPAVDVTGDRSKI